MLCKSAAFLGILWLFMLTSCNQENDSIKTKTNVLHLNIQSEPLSLDPRKGGTTRSQIVTRMLFEGLMSLDSEGNPSFAIAKNVEISDDLTKYTFTLRDTKWSNGQPLTAYDFEYAWKSAVDPSFDTAFSYAFYIIKNAKLAKQGKTSLDEVGVKALDAGTLVIQLEHPAPYFLELVANPIYSPILKSIDITNKQWSRSSNSKGFVSNGPFTLAKLNHNNLIEVVANHHYWDSKSVKLECIDISIVEDSNTALLMFEKGELDWVGEPLSELPLASIPELKKSGKLIVSPIGGVYWYQFNTGSLPFTSAKIRKAFAYAIQRENIVNHILQGGEKTSMSILPQSMGLRDPNVTVGELADARRLFNEGLHELGLSKDQLQPIVLTYTFVPGQKTIAEAVQQQWQTAFGIPIKLEGVEWNVFFERSAKHDFQVAGSTWYSWFNDPIYNLEFLKYKSNGINGTQWEDARYISLLDASDQEKDPEKRLKLLKQAEEIVLDQAPITPLFYNSLRYMKNPKLQGVMLSKLGQINFKHAYFEH